MKIARMFGGVVLTLIILQVFCPSFSQADVSLTFTSKFLSKSVLVNGAESYGDPLFQSDLFVLLPKGFYIDLFWSMGFSTEFLRGADKEIDLTLGWSGDIGKGFILDTGIMYYDLAELFSGKGATGDLIQPFAQIEKIFVLSDTHSLTPYVRLELVFPTRSDMSKGAYLHLGIRHAWTLSDTLALNHKAFVVGDSGVAGFDPAVIVHYRPSLDWKVGKNITLSAPMVNFSTPVTSVSDGRKGEIVIGLGISVPF